MRGKRGFTMIELLVAIAVVTILSLIALPSFLDRRVRSQITEGLPLADLAKPAVEAAWRAKQPLPADNAAAGLPPPDKIVNQVVRSVTLDNGAIHIVFGNQAVGALKDKTVTVRPAGVDDARIVPLTWLCGVAPAPEKATAQGTNKTDVPAGLLPIRCR
jgi:type IV pilus assembly protein PilA